MGSGRSGTSLVAGMLSGAGYFMGPHILPPTPSNPKGYFESYEIQEINEDILSTVVRLPLFPRRLTRLIFRDRLGRDELWLARIPLEAVLCPTKKAVAGILGVTGRRPYCFKDPRFCYTLPAWRPYLRDTVYICVFRDPSVTVESILKDCRERPYLRYVAMTPERAFGVWTIMYRHVLDIHRHQGEWLFLHYDQGFTEEGSRRLEELTGARVDRNIPDPALRRSRAARPAPAAAVSVYRELCRLAGHVGAS